MSSMDTSAPAPRVNGELLARFVGRKVLLVGKAESLEGGMMRMRTSDDRVVSVELKGGAAGYSSDFVEFEAVVKSADSVREEEHTSFGSAFGARPCDDGCARMDLAARARGALRGLAAHPGPKRTMTDMGNYDALVKLINGEAQSLFF
jgi:replication factor A3